MVAAGPGVITLAGLALHGTSVAWSIIGGVAVTALVVGFFAAVSALTGRPFVPDLFVGVNEPAELLEGHRWPSRERAEREARRRNLNERNPYWIEVRVGQETWGIERRRFRGRRDGQDLGLSDYSWFGGDFGGGGGGDGGG